VNAATQGAADRLKLDGTRHTKAAPFRRNDQMLAVAPIGVIAFPGSRISAVRWQS